MKTRLLFLSCVFAAINAFGQDYVTFANTSTTLLRTNGSSIGQGTGNISGSNQWRIGLYIAPDGVTDESQFTLVAVATNISFAPGRFSISGNPIPISGNTGQPIAFRVRAWSLSSGFTYAQALTNLNGYLGQSPIGRITPVPPPAVSPAVFGTGDFTGQLTAGFDLVPNSGPSVYVQRPERGDLLEPGSVFTVRWFATRIPTTNWIVSLTTNNFSSSLPLAATPVDDGGGSWHADITMPVVPLGDNNQISVYESSSGVRGFSESFRIGTILGIRFSQVEICWHSVTGITYQVQYSTNLSATPISWINLGAAVAGNGTTNCATDSILLSKPPRTYRVVHGPP